MDIDNKNKVKVPNKNYIKIQEQVFNQNYYAVAEADTVFNISEIHLPIFFEEVVKKEAYI